MVARISYQPKTSPADIERFNKVAEETWAEALKHYEERDEWKVSKEGPDGAMVYSKKAKKGGRTLFKLEGIAHLDVDTFFKKFFSIEEAEDTPRWNTTMSVVQVLQEVDPSTHVCYQATTALGPGGIVSSRDVTYVRRMKKVEDKSKGRTSYIVCYASIDLPDVPPIKNIVRSDNFPSAVIIETPPNGDTEKVLVTWIVDADLKLSLVPSAVFNQVFQYTLLDNMKCIRERADKLRTGEEKI